MLIPSGWIHSVWTPEDSLVIGGNFLTRLHLGMQLRINEVEKNTGVEVKYRYPFFQKVQWYTMMKYLEDEPVPDSVRELLYSGRQFPREVPVWTEYDNGLEGKGDYSSQRYYAKSEMEGWPDLLSFILRTVLIHLDQVDGITQKTRNAVSRSIPKAAGDALETVRSFACWVAWKRGNEEIPSWAYPDGALPSRLDQKDQVENKTEKQEKTPTPADTRKADRRNAGCTEARTSHRLGPKKVVCDSCREKKIACKHVDPQTLAGLTLNTSPNGAANPQPGDGVTSKQRDKELGGRLSLNSDGKRRWGKACVDCRKSKVSMVICLRRHDNLLTT
jgi:F-box/leucine-rich repeat protein 10/11